MKEYVLQVAKFNDPPGYREEKQTLIDEAQVNEVFSPANDVLSGLREAGDWMVGFVSEFTAQIFGNLM